KRLDAWITSLPRGVDALLLELLGVLELNLKLEPLLLLEHRANGLGAFLVHEIVHAPRELLDLHRVVSEKLRRGVDGGEPTADDDGGKLDLQVGEGAPLVGTRELERHQEVARLADALRQVVLQLDDRGAPGACGEGDVIESERPRILEGQRPAKANP